MIEFNIVSLNYEQRRLEHFKEQKAAAESKLKYWMSRKKHCSSSHEWLPIEEKCSECGDLISFYANAIAVFERSLGNEEQRHLAEKLREHAEWAHANEWETPITLGDDLEAAANTIEQLKATAEASSAQAAMCDVTMERCDQLQKELEHVKRERDAAVMDLRSETYYCETCANYTPGYFCLGCRNKSNWQWRGVKEEENADYNGKV